MKKLTKNQEIILEIISKNNELSISQLLEIAKFEKRTAQRVLKSLVDLDLIEVLGSTRDRVYRRIFTQEETPFKYVVFQTGVRVGELQFGNGFYQFEYYENYNGELLSGLEFNKLNIESELFAVFENLIPEYERRERLLFNIGDIAEALSELNNAHGSFDFIPKHKLFEYKPNYGKRKNWITQKNKILQENSFPNLLSLEIKIDDAILDAQSNSEHSDLSGYQTKVDVDIDFTTNTIVESKNAEYLLKPRNREKIIYFNMAQDSKKQYFPYIALNEHLFMSFAKNELGFDVPYTGIIKAKDGDFHYITKRYDRIDNMKYNQIDFAQILNKSSSQKYNASSEELFEAINRTMTSVESKLDALKFYYYSYLIKHADLHLKNIAALEIGMKKYILAPLYDVISIGVYNGESLDLALGMKKPYKKPKNWKLQDFYKLADIIGVSELQFKKEARVITKIFLIEFPKYITKLQEFEETDPLPMQTTRVGSYKTLTQRVENMYKERIIRLKKLGIIEELELVNDAGRLLKSHKA